MNRLALQQGLSPGKELFRIAFVLAQPMLENFVDRGSFPPRRVVRVNVVKLAKTKDGLGIESEGIGLEPVDLGHPDVLRPLLRRRAGLGLRNRLCGPRVV